MNSSMKDQKRAAVRAREMQRKAKRRYMAIPVDHVDGRLTRADFYFMLIGVGFIAIVCAYLVG